MRCSILKKYMILSVLIFHKFKPWISVYFEKVLKIKIYTIYTLFSGFYKNFFFAHNTIYH